MIRQWLPRLKMTSRKSRPGSHDQRGRRRWQLEGLEDRVLLSGGSPVLNLNPSDYTVNSTGDTGTGSGSSGDLRFVITQANGDPDPNGSLITFDPTVFASPQQINLSRTLELSETHGPEMIVGPPSLVAVYGNKSFGDLVVDAGVKASVSGLDIENGWTGRSDGGGIDNEGTLTLTQDKIENNKALRYGGGISNLGTLTVNDSVIANNTVTGDGAGIFNEGTLSISRSLVLGNAAGGDGGGIFNDADSQLNLSNSTLFLNSAADGGAVINIGSLVVVNCTITGNEVVAGGVGGGLDNAGSTATLNNTIVVSNFAPANTGTHSDIGGGVSAASSFNLIGPGGSGGITNGDNGNQVGVDGAKVFGDYVTSGVGLVIPLSPGSPAIDKGSNALAVDPNTGQPLLTDQRGAGFGRISNSTVDIGAYELQQPTRQPIAINGPGAPGRRSIVGVSVLWGTSGFSALQTALDGLRLLPEGRTTDLPWKGIKQFQITLDEPATLASADITVKGANGASYGPVTIFGSGTFYTFTLARPIVKADRITITIDGTSLVTYTRRLDVLPGDTSDDGVVNRKDITGIRNQFKRTGGATPTIFGDILGDGAVDARDSKAESRLVGEKLPKLGGKIPKAVLARVLARGHTSTKALIDLARI